ncbi:caspase domain-containing protein [Trametes elegans]|nr:caspase domain-containing protein [Trametes elegans]
MPPSGIYWMIDNWVSILTSPLFPAVSPMPNDFSRHTVSADDGTTKKALLIGPNYGLAMAEMLMACYGYLAENIVMLLDDGSVDPGRAPTRSNILRAFDWLVEGARAGDHCLLYYSGHTDLVERSVDRPDDPDDRNTYLIPSDHADHAADVPYEERMVGSHEIRKLLVDALPPGATLYTIVDSCHSGHILGLPHDKCNDIYVPWISPGFRRRMTRWRGVRRRDGHFMDPLSMMTAQNLRSIIPRRRNRDDRNISGPSAGGRKSSTSSIHVVQCTSRTHHSSEVITTETSVNVREGTLRRCSYRSSISRKTGSSIATVLSGLFTTDESASILDGMSSRRCMSPAEDFECNGFDCSSHGPDTFSGPNVISISSCKEYQRTWDSKHHSFTQTLIHALRQDPHQTLAQLMHTLTFQAYNHCRSLHQWSKKQRAREKLAARLHGMKPEDLGELPLEMNNYTEPQVASLRAAVLQEPFDP